MDLRVIIQQFIDSDKTEINVPMAPIIDYNDALGSFKYYNDGDWAPVSWRCYFNIIYNNDITHKTIKFTGSLFLGDFKLIKL